MRGWGFCSGTAILSEWLLCNRLAFILHTFAYLLPRRMWSVPVYVPHRVKRGMRGFRLRTNEEDGAGSRKLSAGAYRICMGSPCSNPASSRDSSATRNLYTLYSPLSDLSPDPTPTPQNSKFRKSKTEILSHLWHLLTLSLNPKILNL